MTYNTHTTRREGVLLAGVDKWMVRDVCVVGQQVQWLFLFVFVRACVYIMMSEMLEMPNDV